MGGLIVHRFPHEFFRVRFTVGFIEVRTAYAVPWCVSLVGRLVVGEFVVAAVPARRVAGTLRPERSEL